MSRSLRPTTPEDLEPLRQFLSTTFDVDASVPWLQPAMLQWKYWAPRGDWAEPRSYVLERDGTIVAHAALWPLPLQRGEVAVRGVQMLDWAAARNVPGAGLTLVQRLATMFDFMYSVGGSEATRKVLPAFGFAVRTQQWKGVRPLHPLRHAMHHGQRTWKLPARFLRNALWSLRSPADSDARWSAHLCEPANVAQTNTSSCLSFSPRPAAFFSYLAACPTAAFHLYQLQHDGAAAGHFLLSLVRGQVRLAGAWLLSPAPETWSAAYALACRAAAALPGACELAVSGSAPGPSQEAAERAGFRTWQGAPVFLLDKQDKAGLCEHFQFQFSDDDQAFLDSGTPDFWC